MITATSTQISPSDTDVTDQIALAISSERPEVLSWLAEFGETATRVAVVLNEYTTPIVLSDLMSDPSTVVSSTALVESEERMLF